MNQCETFIVMFDILYPNRQLYYEVDWSSGRAKMKDDGWNVGKMNVRFGGKQQQTMKDSVLLPGCIGPKSLLKVGDTQEFTFREGVLLPMNKNVKKEDHEAEQSIPKKRRKPGDPTTELHWSQQLVCVTLIARTYLDTMSL